MANNNERDTEKEEKKREDEKVRLRSKSKVFAFISKMSLYASMFFLTVYLLIQNSYEILQNLKIPISDKATTFILEACVGFFVLSILIFLIKLMPPSFDFWIKDLASKRLSTRNIYFDRKYLYIEYDIALKRQDIKDFVSEMSNKSNFHSYYLSDISIDNQVIIVAPGKKKVIPTRCVLEKIEDTAWNIVPLGEAVNNKLKTITPIGWWLNDNIVREDVVLTLPSTSLMIAGGTGSGKSVVENGIIGHITRFSDDIQGLLIDVKKVEFGGLESYRGIKKVGITIEDCDSIIEQARKIMYDRFTFMEKNGVNNIYKLEMDVDRFSIKGESFQFDEIFDCRINDASALMTLDELYKAIQDVEYAEIADYNFKGLTRITKNDIVKTTGKFKPKAVLILVDELGEVMNDPNYRLVSTIQSNIASIARLGRAAGVHLCLATQRPSGNIINADLKNNIQMGVLLGDFDSGASSLIFDKDISDISKPEIKGRGYVGSGKDIVEFQSYWTEKEKDFAIKKDHETSQDGAFVDTASINVEIESKKESSEEVKIETEELVTEDKTEEPKRIVLKLKSEKPVLKLNMPVAKEDVFTIAEDS